MYEREREAGAERGPVSCALCYVNMSKHFAGMHVPAYVRLCMYVCMYVCVCVCVNGGMGGGGALKGSRFWWDLPIALILTAGSKDEIEILRAKERDGIKVHP